MQVALVPHFCPVTVFRVQIAQKHSRQACDPQETDGFSARTEVPGKPPRVAVQGVHETWFSQSVFTVAIKAGSLRTILAGHISATMHLCKTMPQLKSTQRSYLHYVLELFIPEYTIPFSHSISIIQYVHPGKSYSSQCHYRRGHQRQPYLPSKAHSVSGPRL